MGYRISLKYGRIQTFDLLAFPLTHEYFFALLYLHCTAWKCNALSKGGKLSRRSKLLAMEFITFRSLQTFPQLALEPFQIFELRIILVGSWRYRVSEKLACILLLSRCMINSSLNSVRECDRLINLPSKLNVTFYYIRIHVYIA